MTLGMMIMAGSYYGEDSICSARTTTPAPRGPGMQGVSGSRENTVPESHSGSKKQ